MHVLSQTMIKMIRDFCKSESENIEDWMPFIEVIDKVDRLVDICNARHDCRVECLNWPKHKHVFELFSILQLFEEWRDQAGGFNKKLSQDKHMKIYSGWCSGWLALLATISNLTNLDG